MNYEELKDFYEKIIKIIKEEEEKKEQQQQNF